jgi:multidrug efflux pump
MKQKLSFLWTFLIDRFRVTTLFIIIISVAGIGAFMSIPREITPTIDIPVANIITVWPGASPGDVENLITNKIEKNIKGLENIEEYTSRSLSGVSLITVEFQLGTNTMENMQRLREKIDESKRDLPASLPDDPQINEISMSDISLLSLTLSGDYSWSELKQFAELIQDELDSIPQVKDVSIQGAPEDKVHIVVDPLLMQSKNLTVSQIAQEIRSAHRDMPLGQVSVSGQDIEITVQGEMETPQEFMDVPIANKDGALIRLGDIAEVRREFDEFEVETFFGTKTESKPAVLISMTKSAAKGNVVTMVSDAFTKVERLREQGQLPNELNIDITFNRSNDIQESLNTLTDNGKQTLILIAIVMLIALGWRESLLASVSIPISLLIGIIVLYLLGETFNGISLFALVLSIGLLVDNAIIVVEGIYQGIYEKKLSPRDAALFALETFRWPIIAGTLTTVFAFLPMLYFISGISGQYVRIIPIAVMTVLFGALFMTLFLLPSIGVRFYEKIPAKKHKAPTALPKVQKWYESFMKPLLSSNWKTLGILALSVGVFIWSVSLLITGKVPTEVFPGSDETIFGAEIRFPEGTNLEVTKSMIPKVEEALLPYFEPRENGEIWLKNFIFTAGDSPSIGGRGGANISSENVLGITVNLTGTEDRQTQSFDIVPVMREDLEKIVPPELELEVFEQRGGPPTGAAIQVKVKGDDLPRLETLSDNIVAELEQVDGLVNISDSRSEKITQISWNFRRDVLKKLNITPAAIMDTLRASVNGITVVQLIEGDDEIDVDLRIDWTGDKQWRSPESLDALNRIPLPVGNGQYVSFEQIADPSPSSEFSNIEHEDGSRIITISSGVRRGKTASEFSDEIQEIINRQQTLPGETILLSGDTEEGNKIVGEMLNAMLAALMLIFLVLVWQFNSFSQPLIILGLIPLSLTAVFIGFWILNVPIGFPTMIGILALAGIIVNDAIVLIDRINHRHRKEEKDIVTGYILAGKERMQPIFLTSITTVVGLLPLALSDPFWMGLGFAIICGMAVSTILTLILTPCMMITLQRFVLWSGKLFKPKH